MPRVSVSLDERTTATLARLAQCEGTSPAALAAVLIGEAIAQRDILARDYAAGRDDEFEIINEMEAAQLELLGCEGDPRNDSQCG